MIPYTLQQTLVLFLHLSKMSTSALEAQMSLRNLPPLGHHSMQSAAPVANKPQPDVAPAADMEGWEPLAILQQVWGHNSFRGEQGAVIARVTAGEDALVLMPTGGGKSISYQIPALARRGMAVIISPLVSLMHDQVDRLHKAGVTAACITGTTSPEDRYAYLSTARSGGVKLLYVAPERFVTPEFRHFLSQCELSLFAIDEAHCVSLWGHDFRPDYLKVGEVCASFPGIPRIAVTATATMATQTDLLAQLKMSGTPVYRSSFNRANISYDIVRRVGDGRSQLLDFMAGYKGKSGIVFCLSRNSVDALAVYLQTLGIDALPYHAGMPGDIKRSNQDRFLKEDGVVIVATIAFGMGIDKADVRFVAHICAPGSVESYSQETGRAGRDGNRAVAWMAWAPGDFAMRKKMQEAQEDKTDLQRFVEQDRLDGLLAILEGPECRRSALLRHFGETVPPSCGTCDRCVERVAGIDATEEARTFLKAVLQTREVYGTRRLCDLVSGRQTAEIVGHQMHKSPLFGIGRPISDTQWRSIARQMVSVGLMKRRIADHNALSVTRVGEDLIAGHGTFSMMADETPTAPTTPTRPRVPQHRSVGIAEGASPERQKLHAALCVLREALAAEEGIPPILLLSDVTLMEIVEATPKTMSQLSRVSGLGPSKLARYGATILAEVLRNSYVSPLPDRIQIPLIGF